MLTFQKEYSNLEKDIISKRMSNEGSGDVDRYNVEKKLELEIQKIIEENIKQIEKLNNELSALLKGHVEKIEERFLV